MSPDPEPATFVDKPVVATVSPAPAPSSTIAAEPPDADATQKAAAEAKRKTAAEAKRKAAAEAKRKAVAEAKRRAAAEAKRKAAAEAKRKAAAEAKRRAQASAKSYPNCSALNDDYPHGVGLPGATDHTSGGDPVTTFKESRPLYEANSGSDGDGDHIACEKK
jgi:hypothetical protein